MSVSMAFRASHVSNVGVVSNCVLRRLRRINRLFLRVFRCQNNKQHVADHHDQNQKTQGKSDVFNPVRQRFDSVKTVGQQSKTAKCVKTSVNLNTFHG